MFIQDFTVKSNSQISEGTYLLEVSAPELVDNLKPGQFFNLQVNDNSFPLLRRPFSISDVKGDSIFFMYKIVGEGTKIISQKSNGDKINLLGPLGNYFETNLDYDHFVLLGGGIGIAPFPFVIKNIPNRKSYSVLFGVRNKEEAHEYELGNISYSSDDGSIGIDGNVIDLLDQHLKTLESKKVKILACGPNPMFRALQKYIIKTNLDCDISMESAMACGFGICQGCPVEYKDDSVYKLICKDGPVFNIRDVKI